MSPELLTILFSEVVLIITVIGTAWINYNATIRAGQQVLEGIQLSNQQLLGELNLALSLARLELQLLPPETQQSHAD